MKKATKAPAKKTAKAKPLAKKANVAAKKEATHHAPVKKPKVSHSRASTREVSKKQHKSSEKLPIVSALEQVRDLTDIIFYPLITEKSVGMIEKENKLGFVVSDKANKQSIKKAVQDVYAVRVSSVNVIRDRKGRKKAFVTLSKESKASDVAVKLGVI